MDRRNFLATATAAGLLLLAPEAWAGFTRGLLWEVARPGVKSNWLFGTLHQPDARVLSVAEAVDAAFRQCRSLIIELYPDEAVTARFSEAARLDDGQRLDRLLPEPVFAALASHLEKQGVTAELAARLKPWAALLMVTALPPDGGATADTSLDNQLFIRARYANMRVEELDSVEEQIAVFDAIPLASQLALLEAAVEFHDLLPGIARESVDAYLARDLARLYRLGRALETGRPALAEHQRVLEKKVVADRSVVMAFRMQAYLRRGQTFVAVGASHLYGDQGLPSLLRRDYGWQVRRRW